MEIFMGLSDTNGQFLNFNFFSKMTEEPPVIIVEYKDNLYKFETLKEIDQWSYDIPSDSDLILYFVAKTGKVKTK